MAVQKSPATAKHQVKPLVPSKKNLTDKRWKFVFPLIIFISCFLLYGNTINNDYTLDDGIYTNKNDFIIKGFSSFNDIFDKGSLYGFDKNPATQYRPLTLLNFMAEVSIFGFNPHVSHFFNICFYAITIVLLYFFLQRILKNYNKSIIIAATLLFAFHPIHTEVVASIKSRDEILGLLFGLISFYLIMIYADQNKLSYYFLSLSAFLVAIFCKENCLAFVLIIPLLLYFFTSLEVRKIILRSLPYAGLVAFYLVIRSIVLHSMTFLHPIPVMDNALMSASSSTDKIATSFVLLGKYIYMTLIPYPLSWDYSYNQIPVVPFGNIKCIFSLLVCIILVVFMFSGIIKKSIFSFLIALFFITLALSSNFIIKIASTFGERFLYSPSLSLCIALPILVSKAIKLNPTQSVWKINTNFYIYVICILIIYTIIVIPRNADWKSNLTLFSSGIVTSPNSARAHLSLAQEYGEELKHVVSKDEQQQLLIKDTSETYRALTVYNKYPEAYYNLGVLYISAGLKDSALLMFQKALSVRPDYAAAANNLGILYAQKEDYNNALKYFSTAINADSVLKGVFLNVGTLYQKAGDPGRAEQYYLRGLKINPGDTDIKNSLFILYYNLGKDCFNKNQYAQALKQFMQANSYNSQSAEVNGYLGAIYQSGRDFSRAEEFYRKSLVINPNNPSIQRNLETVIELQSKR